MVPADLRYTKDHEWVRIDGDEATVGITEYAAEPARRHRLRGAARGRAQRSAQFAAFGVVESVKAVSDLFAPLTGEVTDDERRAGRRARSSSTATRTARAGWSASARRPGEVDELLDAPAYDALIAAG